MPPKSSAWSYQLFGRHQGAPDLTVSSALLHVHPSQHGGWAWRSRGGWGVLLPLREQLCLAEEVLCLLTSGSGISGFLATKSPGHRELPPLEINFPSPPHAFQELKDNIFSNLIYSYHIGNSQLTPTPLALQQRDAHPSRRLQTSLTAPHRWAFSAHFAAGTQTLV